MVTHPKPAKIIRIFDQILNFATVLAAILSLFIVFSMAADVILRYGFDRPIWWLHEILEYALLWITFLVAAWVLRLEGHVAMDIVVKRFSPAVQGLVNMITSLFGTLAILVVVWYGGVVTWGSFRLGVVEAESMLRSPQAPILLIIPVGSFLLLLQMVRRTYGYAKQWRGYAGRKQTPSGGAGMTDAS